MNIRSREGRLPGRVSLRSRSRPQSQPRVKLLLDENLSPCLVNRGSLAGIIYAPDFQNNFYGVNSLTVPPRSFGKTGIPAIPFIPGSLNADGTINFYDQAIFAAGGKLYTTLDAFVFDGILPGG
jgi:hypothetical protein